MDRKHFSWNNKFTTVNVWKSIYSFKAVHKILTKFIIYTDNWFSNAQSLNTKYIYETWKAEKQHNKTAQLYGHRHLTASANQPSVEEDGGSLSAPAPARSKSRQQWQQRNCDFHVPLACTRRTAEGDQSSSGRSGTSRHKESLLLKIILRKWTAEDDQSSSGRSETSRKPAVRDHSQETGNTGWSVLIR